MPFNSEFMEWREDIIAVSVFRTYNVSYNTTELGNITDGNPDTYAEFGFGSNGILVLDIVYTGSSGEYSAFPLCNLQVTGTWTGTSNLEAGFFSDRFQPAARPSFYSITSSGVTIGRWYQSSSSVPYYCMFVGAGMGSGYNLVVNTADAPRVASSGTNVSVNFTLDNLFSLASSTARGVSLYYNNDMGVYCHPLILWSTSYPVFLGRNIVGGGFTCSLVFLSSGTGTGTLRINSIKVATYKTPFLAVTSSAIYAFNYTGFYTPVLSDGNLSTGVSIRTDQVSYLYIVPVGILPDPSRGLSAYVVGSSSGQVRVTILRPEYSHIYDSGRTNDSSSYLTVRHSIFSVTTSGNWITITNVYPGDIIEFSPVV